MERHVLDDLLRTLAQSRRSLLAGVAATAAGWLGVSNAETKKKHKKQKKRKKKRTAPQPAFNQFGCLDVGQPYRGDSALCCSGICEGAAPAPGQPDTSACVAHNAGTCTMAINSCAVGGPVQCVANNPGSRCLRTTGNAAFYGDMRNVPETYCRICAKDADCLAEFGPGAACVHLDGPCSPFCDITGLTACVPPAA